MPPDRSARTAPGAPPLARHLARGAIGFGLVAAAIVLAPSVGPASLLLVLPGAVALRGCPTCWVAGLVQIVSAGRLERSCTDAGCTLRPSSASPRDRA